MATLQCCRYTLLPARSSTLLQRPTPWQAYPAGLYRSTYEIKLPISHPCVRARFDLVNSHVLRTYTSQLQSRQFSSDDSPDKNLTVLQRFTQVYKEYGKTLIGVHIVTSIAWYGGFYILAKSGIDLLPMIVKLGASEALQAKVAAAGDFVVAYLLYEIAKPIRYLVTLGVTRQAVVYMRKIGFLPPIKPEDKLRNLAKDGRDNLKDKYQERREDVKERYAEKKAEYQEKWRVARKQDTLQPPSSTNQNVSKVGHQRSTPQSQHRMHEKDRQHREKPSEPTDNSKSHRSSS